MATLTFDDINKIITVDVAFVEITIQELHNTIREYEDGLVNMDLKQIVSSGGKEPLGGGVSVGITLTLLNDWRLAFAPRTGPAYVQCNVSGGNLVAVNVNGSIYPTAFTQVVVTASSSATASDIEAVQFSSFGGGVSIDTTSANTGTTYPVGNKEYPVNNVPDARTIAEARGFTTFFIRGDITLDTGDDISDFKVTGENTSRSTITINTGAATDNCEITDAHVTGILDNGIIVRDSIIDDLVYVDGIIYNTMLNPGTITLGNNSTGHFINCFSGVPGTDTPIIDMGGSGQALALRNYNGGIELRNKSGADSVSIDLNSGQIILASTITNGTLVLRGIGKLTDNSVGATVLAEDLITGARLNELQTLVTQCRDGMLGNAYYDPNAGTLELRSYDTPVSVIATFDITIVNGNVTAKVKQ